MTDVKGTLAAITEEFNKKHILVIGDLMVDRYINGKFRKISQEAPIPVFNYVDEHLVPGGAGNVVNNLLGLGAKVSVSGVLSYDTAGKWLLEELSSKTASTEGIVVDINRQTTMKTRYITKGYQLFRVDKEDTDEISEQARNDIFEYCKKVIADVDAVILSDYQKGVLKNEEFVKRIIRLCVDNNVFVAADTKTENIQAFKDVNILTPNLDELANAVKMSIGSKEDIDKAGWEYLNMSGAKMLVLTRGEEGISVFAKDKSREDFPPKSLEVIDVSGAGDTVISTVTMGLISGMSLEDSVKLANIAAGVVIVKRGTVAICQKELIESVDEGKDC